MVVFNGFNLAEESAPKALRWIPKVCASASSPFIR